MIAFLLAILIVSFIAGMVALAMPCCFTVLLPAYVAKSFDTLSGRLVMTVVFGAGIATVLLPIALGVSVVAAFIISNHALFFIIGGFFMIILGLGTLWGISFLPMMTMGVDLKRKDLPSVYTLGVFSGVASSCCAPVLAGVLVLAILPGNWLSALFVALAYVAGMVFPLLIVALAWDKKAVRIPNFLHGRIVNIRLLGMEISIHSSKLIAGSLFISMGAVTIALGVLDRMISVPGSDIFGIYQTSLENALLSFFSNQAAVAALIIVLTIVFAYFVLRVMRTKDRRYPGDAEKMEEGHHESACDDPDVVTGTEDACPSCKVTDEPSSG